MSGEKLKEIVKELEESSKNAFAYIGGRLKVLNKRIGDLTALKTSGKNSTVEAINEVFDMAQNASGGGVDLQTVRQEIKTATDAAKNEVKNELLGGSPEENLNSIMELGLELKKLAGDESIKQGILDKFKLQQEAHEALKAELEAIKTVLKTDFVAIIKTEEGVLP